MSDLKNRKLPELLCPAGTWDAFEAAVEGGADAVYLGGETMNARIHAGNFSKDELQKAVRTAHIYGVKVYLTLNTLVTDRELAEGLQAAREAVDCGVDALIMADAGLAAAVHRAFPQMELHASTQMSGHNHFMGAELKQLGFSRMVAAREISEENLKLLMKTCPLEVEIFVHGALCVSHSGQCLFSSLVGGRSGNRGACAQPCRLPFSCGGCSRHCGGRKQESYPLSLKDLTLAAHVPDLIELGVSSLKIEGRMKSPEYVYRTAGIWRRLLDERRGATKEELSEMAQAFSRSGFTDGYFTSRISHSMLGVRSESDKQTARQLDSFRGLTKKKKIGLQVTVKRGEPVTLTLSDGSASVTERGTVPEEARTAPMTEESVLRSICRFGATPFEPSEPRAFVEEGLMVPVSALNALRRSATEALIRLSELPAREENPVERICPKDAKTRRRSARFYRKEQITDAARAYFDVIYLPLFSYDSKADGVILPPVIFDGDVEAVKAQLKKVCAMGANYVSVGNIGHFQLVEGLPLTVVGDFRLNITNTESAARYESMGCRELLLSPELSVPQLRDIKGNTSAIVYGRIPLMTLEKCVIKEISDCKACETGKVRIADRRGVEFPVLREWEHRNVIYNSLPTCMSDRLQELKKAGLDNLHFIFSDESPSDVDRIVKAFRTGSPISGQVRRIGAFHI